MSGVLDGIRVVEVSAWAFVPSAGAVLADWGAEVLKVEPPLGDPLRGLVNAGVGPTAGLSFPWEIWNRGKRSLALDLNQPRAQEIVHDLVATADVFLTSYLPATRKKLGLDLETIRAKNPSIIYASGTGRGPRGPEAEKGGYDAITFWSRGSVSAACTPPDYHRPIGMPAGAFGDSLSGMSLAGGVAAALLKRERTGAPSVVDGSLLGTAMWCMQMSIVGAAVARASAEAAGGNAPGISAANIVFNPLVNNYRTSDDRWLALCMLQPDLYWEGLCRAIGREDLLADPRFAKPADWGDNVPQIISELEATFASRPLAECKAMLETQKGQWDVVNHVTDMPNDPQALANGFIQTVAYTEGRELQIISSPVQFDRTPPELTPAPEFGADTDEVLQGLGMDMDAIIEAKTSGAVI